MNILLVEDNHTIARQLAEFLNLHTWQVEHAHCGKQAIQWAQDNLYDVVLLDLNLPDMDGLQVCETIKQLAPNNPPILMLTARDSFADKVRGFNQGADDYLTKPFDLREVVLRCEALARRHTLHRQAKMSLGELTLDNNQQQVTRQQREIKLTQIGFKILHELMLVHPAALSKRMLSHKIWQDNPPQTEALKSHIYALRNALDKPFEHKMLLTVANVGYRLDIG
ncbi:response regulator transcription factor [Paraglaciecola hydrolytica]|uniref:XRE family transcriptional regulator n=1 Tax=Paraglaciecola hydrolytica TaxID=1799789 RepID=A0A136A063_9ALTE|nr:response regulator transcription factor [Paraglaciecola hydrolytica]KXI28636.1 XRE family transcriptional regulator [Paraglaciecola hydrolytica]